MKSVKAIIGLAMIANALAAYNTKGKRRANLEGYGERKIPVGVNAYHFNIDGHIIPGSHNAVFSCLPRDQKNALRKYQNWKKTQK